MRGQRMVLRAGTRRRSSGGVPVLPGLVGTIEGEIIPRLMRVHRIPIDPTAGWPRPGPDEVDTLMGLALAEEAAPAIGYVEGLIGRGMPPESVYLDLIGPAARQFGSLWDEDRLDFLQVTLGLCRLQQIVQQLGASGSAARQPPLPRPTALLASLPGDQHTLGLHMVGNLFRRRGWHARELPAATPDELTAVLRCDAVEVFGLSVACEARLGQAAAIIAAVRRAACGRDIVILVGGQAFAGHAARVAEVGADATAPDGLRAVASASELVAARSSPAC